MQKQAPTLGRLLVMAGFALSCFGILLFLWLAFGGPTPLKAKGYRFRTSFAEATQLAQEADVTISGVRVGKVRQLSAGRDGRTQAIVELERRYAPLPSDSRAVLRQKTLLGETYVELSPGSPSAPVIREGGVLAASRVSATVELDEIFRAFDGRTRASFQVWLQSLAQGFVGRGRDLSDVFGNLPVFAEQGNEVLRVLASQQGATRRLVANTGQVFAALTERRGQLRGLVSNAERVFGTLASRSEEVRGLFRALPAFEREGKLTVERVTRFARDTDPLVSEFRPVARQLAPTLREARLTAVPLKSFFAGLGPLFDASVRGLPAFERFLGGARPLLGQLDPWLRSLNPVLRGLDAYKHELTAFIANATAVTQAEGPNQQGVRKNYLRGGSVNGPEMLALFPQRIGTNRSNAYQLPEAFRNLAAGLPVYDDRNCGRAVPKIDPAPSPYLSEDLRDLINAFVLTPSGPQAGPCVKQGKVPALGAVAEQTQFPRVRQDAKP